MKKTRLLSLLLLLCIGTATLLFPSCGAKKSKYTAHSLDYFDTVTTITGYESDKNTFDAVSGEILRELAEYHRLYTVYHRYEGLENLCTVNSLENGVHPTVTVDPRITDMLSFALEMYDLSAGRVNVAMGSVLSLWHEYRTAGLEDPRSAALPPMELLTEAAQHTDVSGLLIDTENSTVRLADPAMTLDVGAIAKGYAVEMTAQSLEARGITGYVINVGGNVRTVGTKPDGEKWLAGIENPLGGEDSPYAAYLLLAGESLVTSGSYQRFYTVGDKNYHHIIDAQTLMPAEGYLSVSVVCKNAAVGDALSTALFCMTPEAGLALVEGLADTEALWILSDGSRQTSSGFAKYETEP